MRLRNLSAVACMAIAACATTGPLEPPKVTVSSVSIDSFTAADGKFTVQLLLANPNFREIAIAAIAAELRIEDVAIGTARLAAPVRLPARGETTATIAAQADLMASLRAGAEIARRLGAEGQRGAGVRYTVAGTATLDGGAVVPFSRSGEYRPTVRTLQ
ncbi:MAG: LEA type 2 family protein [Burkholderiales bacterium]